MPETEQTKTPEDLMLELQSRADDLERQLSAIRTETDTRLIRAELKAEAVRAGIVDLDGLKLLDLSAAKLDGRGEVEGAAQLLAQLKRAKPWLFGAASSSNPASPPAAQPMRQKLAGEMTTAEWRAARADLVRRRF
jgi:hypothetical protein